MEKKQELPGGFPGNALLATLLHNELGARLPVLFAAVILHNS